MPYEQNGLQVAPIFPLQDFFAERLGGMEAGIPSNALPHAMMSYDFNGPANGKDSWYKPRQQQLRAARCRLHTARTGATVSSASCSARTASFAAAAACLDRFGSDLVTQFDNAASFGLTDISNLGPSVNFTTGPRYLGTLPTIPAAAAARLPIHAA